ncbi:hypothetical protein GOBAR_AA11835 [Gossypium barbadense]|uniref:Uncharacterized protein n=1 Tax=Gossypium barbadense TaxID=3634 RepID=A0A2P5XZN8_GOSBA|nr:hypothetical protein GOBAR_AA11835 [Gossypium barbadense]
MTILRYVCQHYRDSVSPCSMVMSHATLPLHIFPMSPLISTNIFWFTSQQVFKRIDVYVKTIVNYLNWKAVRKALHAQLVGVKKWTVCSKNVDYFQLQSRELKRRLQ